MKKPTDTYKLYNGVEIPCIGFGTWQTPDGEVAVVDCSREHNMLLEAYSPLGVGRVFEVPEVQALAEKYGRSIAQVCIRWSLERGYLPLPKSVTPSRIVDNLNVFDFELDDEDVSLLAGLTGCAGLESDPDKTGF